MKTVGDVVREIDMIQETIQNLHTIKAQFSEVNSEDCDACQMCCDAIVLLSHYRNALYALPINQ